MRATTVSRSGESAPHTSVKKTNEAEGYSPIPRAYGQVVENPTPEIPEKTSEVAYTSGTFRQKIGELFDSLRQNPGTNFSPIGWLSSTEGDADDAVYARILDNFGEDDSKPLDSYQLDVLAYVQTQIEANKMRAAADLNGQNEEQAIKQLINDVEARKDVVSEADKPALEKALQSMGDTLDRMQPDSKAPKLTGTELAAYVNSVEAGEGKDRLTAVKEQLYISAIRNRNDAITYGSLVNRPRVTAETADQTPEQQSQDLETASKELENLRQQLAVLNAKREKRMWGHDGYTGDAAYDPKNKALYSKYYIASAELFNMLNPNLLIDESLSNTDRIKMIVEHMVAEALMLDWEIQENYRNNNTRFGRAIEWYGNRKVAGKIAVGLGAAAVAGAAGFITGGAGTFAVSGSVMSVGITAHRRKKRADGADMLAFDVDQIMERYKYKDLTGDNAIEGVEDVFSSTSSLIRTAFENRISKAQFKTGIYTLGSYVGSALIGYGTHHIPGGWQDGSNGLLHHDKASAIPGFDSPTIDPHPVVPHVPPPNTGDFSMTIGIPHGGGFFNSTFPQLHIPQDQWHSLLHKIGPDLVQHGDAYWMGNGDLGISHPGPLSQHAIDTIMRAWKN